MKHINLVVLLILVMGISTSSFAQKEKKDKKSKPDKIGIRFGSQTANLLKDGDAFSDFTNLNTFYVGVFKYYNVIPFVKVGSGLDYFQSGTVTNNNNSMHLYYLGIPFNVKAKVGPFFALGGIEPSIKVSEKWEIDGNKITPADSDKANWFDAPVFVGGGFKVLMFSIEARYYWGTSSMYDAGVGEGYKNRYF